MTNYAFKAFEFVLDKNLPVFFYFLMAAGTGYSDVLSG